MSAYLEIWNLSKTYATPQGPLTVVRDFSLSVEEGEFVCLIGHSGCGKSTVLSIVAGLNAKSAGGVILAGREVDGPGIDRGVVFQAPCLLPWKTALDNVLLAVERRYRGEPYARRRARAQEMLVRVGLGNALHRRPAELSAGMRQRVGLARAFVLDPKLLLLDEPFGMLDSLTRFELQEALLELQAHDRKTALMVTHDVDEALFLADRIAMMSSGPEARLGDILEVPFDRPRDRRRILEHPEYGRLRARLIGFLEAAEGIS
ncbi:MAG: ABC transporter ATP-binding protein [Planctomycetota bacterium]